MEIGLKMTPMLLVFIELICRTYVSAEVASSLFT
jgi:hypothetical protein